MLLLTCIFHFKQRKEKRTIDNKTKQDYKYKQKGHNTNYDLESYIILKRCISPNNIENLPYLRKGLVKLRRYRGKLSRNVSIAFSRFIRNHITPIINDKDYFGFMRKEEFGYFDTENNTFVINSEESMMKMLELWYARIVELNGILDAEAHDNNIL